MCTLSKKYGCRLAAQLPAFTFTYHGHHYLPRSFFQKKCPCTFCTLFASKSCCLALTSMPAFHSWRVTVAALMVLREYPEIGFLLIAMLSLPRQDKTSKRQWHFVTSCHCCLSPRSKSERCQIYLPINSPFSPPLLLPRCCHALWHCAVAITTADRKQLTGSLKLGNVWLFVQLIHRPTRTKHRLYKSPNIA